MQPVSIQSPMACSASSSHMPKAPYTAKDFDDLSKSPALLKQMAPQLAKEPLPPTIRKKLIEAWKQAFQNEQCPFQQPTEILNEALAKSLSGVEAAIALDNEFQSIGKVINTSHFPLPIQKEIDVPEALIKEEFFEASSGWHRTAKHTFCLFLTPTEKGVEQFALYVIREFGFTSKNYYLSNPASAKEETSKKLTGSGQERVSSYASLFRLEATSNTAVRTSLIHEAPRMGGILFNQGNQEVVLREFKLWAATRPSVLFNLFSNTLWNTCPMPLIGIISDYLEPMHVSSHSMTLESNDKVRRVLTFDESDT